MTDDASPTVGTTDKPLLAVGITDEVSPTAGITEEALPKAEVPATRWRLVSTRLARVASKYGTCIALLILILVFSILKTSLFLTTANFINIASDVAIGSIIACGLTIPMVANEFDLSIGY